MENELPVRQPSLSEQVYEIIIKGISNRTYPPGSLLPSENQLTERFNVSRPTIRAAFARLVERGYVNRRRGVGTYVTDLPSIVNPLYQSRDVAEWISARGFKAGFLQLKTEIIPADEKISQSLDVEVGINILNVHKVFTADEVPIILFINYIPEWVYKEYLSEDEVLMHGATEPFFEFFAIKCSHRVRFLNSIIQPEIVKNCSLPEVFSFDNPNTPILVIEDIGYNKIDTPIFLSYEYLVREASTFHITRRVENI